MTRLKIIARGYTLVAMGSMEIGLPFLRMVILSRALDLRELGFASALASTYGLFELVTDISVFRFVYSQPREDYIESLSGAHALSLVRGVIVGLAALAISPLIAAAFALQDDWPAFAALAGLVFIRSFEHIEPKVSERDYDYAPQLKTLFVANLASFLALLGAMAVFHDHRALTASLYGIALGSVVASHIMSRTPYRLSFRTPFFGKAFRFGYPLMLSGIGLAVSSQGDRFLVGSMLGLSDLGIYSVVMLAVIVPISMVFRIMGSVTASAFFNASGGTESLARRIRFSARFSPMLSGFYAIGALCLANIVVPAVFGAKFHISQFGLSVLALAAFFRIVRGEPFGALLMLSQRTKKIALGSLASIAALVFAFIVIYYNRTFEAAMTGRVLAELFSLVITIVLARKLLQGADRDYYVSFSIALCSVIAFIAISYLTSVGDKLMPSLAGVVAAGSLFAIWGLLALKPLMARVPSTAVSVVLSAQGDI